MSGLGLTFLRRGGQAHPTVGSDYILSESRGDPEVFRILMGMGVSSDGIGITKEDVAKVTSIGENFHDNAAIVSFDEFRYFESITQVGGSTIYSFETFANCSSLKSIILPPNCKTLKDGYTGGGGRSPFFNCKSLEQIGGIENVNYLGAYSLYGCTALDANNFSLPNLTFLGQNALYGVPAKRLFFPALTSIPAGTTSTQNFGNKTTLEELVLSEDITTIPNYAFLQYKNLGGVVNYPNLTSIGTCAYNTTSISRIENLGSITTILGGNTIEATFGNCAKLYFVRLPATLTSIGKQAFYGCKALETFICESVVPPSLNETTFSSTNSTFVIYVPDDSVEAYKAAANWSAYSARIKGISEYQG